MKSIFVAIFALLIAGCSSNTPVLGLSPYISAATPQAKTKSAGELNIKDSRQNSLIIGTINDNSGNLIDEVLLKTDLSSWFENAFKTELGARGVAIGAGGANISVDIKTLNAAIEGYSKQNMSAKAEVFITIVNGTRTITKRVAQDQSEFAALRNARTMEPFVESMLRDIIKKSADQIVSSL
ncbi:YajG family lipoprotein [Campylobacter sp. VBCF_05 NA6]|uniref:YajG family lipoprotein n=1 Tax=unclassified Campylobacter TaxID=2593542 RepID=UPI0022E9D5C4|nr:MULTISPECIES: YajG family lipoprotein [unclassified Campylobacter]MDA3057899.1 YajG family lipoprotein [Campylobacter sp. VBCF_04 NA7]MDA3059325.1 YajG family lipoprotein [Campylobacter sp. VBCF_05 NA6]